MKKLDCSLRTLRASGQIRTAVLILAGGLVTVILLALLYGSHVTFERELTATFQRHQLTTARSLAFGVEEVFAEVEDDLRGLARHKGLLLETAPPQDEIDAYYDTHTDILNNITVVSAEGNAITRSPKTPKKHNVSKWPEFLGAKDTRKPWIGEPAKCVIDPTETVVRIFVPVVVDGRFNGATYASINLKKLWAKCMKRPEAGHKSLCWVVADGGQLLHHTNSEYVGLTWEQIEDRWQSSVIAKGQEIDDRIEQLERRLRKRVRDGQEGTDEHVNALEGIEELVAFTPIRLGNRTYGLAVVTPKSEISGPIDAHAKVTYGLMAGLALFCVAGGYIVYRGGRARILLAQEKKHADALRQSSEALHASEKQYRTLIENVHDGVYRLDPQGRFTFVNDLVVERSGRPREWFIGRSYLDVIVPEDRQRIQEIFAATMHGEPTPPYQTAYRRASGDVLHIEVNSSPLVEGDEVVGVLAVSRDTTERKKAEEELERHQHHLAELVEQRTAELKAANKELESFSYTVSHDLRAPLRGIAGFTQAIKEDYADRLDAEGREHLNRVLKATARMTQLIDDLLRLSGVTLREMNRETVDLSALVGSIAGELRKAEPSRQVQFIIEPGVTAHGDAALLRLGLQNLMDNAWKFTDGRARATIEFGTVEREDVKAYYVRDDGVGFDMAYVDKLFVPFQRLHPQAEFSGTGIGLATVARIMHRHGGNVWGEGKPEKGATFCFTL